MGRPKKARSSPEVVEEVPEALPALVEAAGPVEEALEDRFAVRQPGETQMAYLIRSKGLNKPIYLEDWPLQGALKDMEEAYTTSCVVGVRERIQVVRWRQLYNKNPAKFMEIRASLQESIRKEERWMGAVVRERDELRVLLEEREGRLLELGREVERLSGEVSELRGRLGGGVDPYEDLSVGKVEGLASRLLGEYGVRGRVG